MFFSFVRILLGVGGNAALHMYFWPVGLEPFMFFFVFFVFFYKNTVCPPEKTGYFGSFLSAVSQSPATTDLTPILSPLAFRDREQAPERNRIIGWVVLGNLSHVGLQMEDTSESPLHFAYLRALRMHILLANAPQAGGSE